MSTSVLIIAAQSESEKQVPGMENNVNAMVGWAKSNGFRSYVLINSPVDLSRLSCDRYFRYYLKSQLRETIKIFLCKHDSRLRKTRNGISVPLPRFLVIYFIGQSSVRQGSGDAESRDPPRQYPEEGLCVGPDMWYTSAEMMQDIGSVSDDWLANSNRRVYLVLDAQRADGSARSDTTANFWQLPSLHDKVSLFAYCGGGTHRVSAVSDAQEADGFTRAWVKSAKLGRTVCEIADSLFQEMRFHQRSRGGGGPGDPRCDSPGVVFKVFRPLLGQCKFCDNSCPCRICKETKTKSNQLVTK